MNGPLSLDETKPILLDILSSIDDCCRRNGIKYSLAFGTLLGAVRHNGFIPWDDDLDLMMNRDDFNKFIEFYSDPRYEIITNKNPSWGWHYIRICDKTTKLVFKECYERVLSHGLWVAIFPVDNAPSPERKWLLHQRHINFWTAVCRLKRSMWAPTGLFLNLAKMCGRVLLSPFSRPFLSKMEERCMCRFNNDMKGNCFIKVVSYHVFPSTIMDEYVEIEFEGKNYLAVKDYDSFLRIEYHDYWELPPLSQRVPRHEYEAFFE